jgi:hypothetical protein
MLGPGCGYIQQQLNTLELELELNGAVSAMCSDRSKFHAWLMAKLINKSLSRSLHNQIKVQQSAPGVSMLSMQEKIPNCPTHKSHTASSSSPGKN